MRAGFDKRWLLPLAILTASALLASGIVVFGRAEGEEAADCSGALSTDFACHRERYRDLVHDSGVEAAFAELKSEYEKNDFVKTTCHQLSHVMGRAAAERYATMFSPAAVMPLLLQTYRRVAANSGSGARWPADGAASHACAGRGAWA